MMVGRWHVCHREKSKGSSDILKIPIMQMNKMNQVVTEKRNLTDKLNVEKQSPGELLGMTLECNRSLLVQWSSATEKVGLRSLDKNSFFP